jgi:hypothetical protein
MDVNVHEIGDIIGAKNVSPELCQLFPATNGLVLEKDAINTHDWICRLGLL